MRKRALHAVNYHLTAHRNSALLGKDQPSNG